MLNPELANNDIMYTAVNVLPGICLVMPASTANSNSTQHTVLPISHFT